MQIKSFACVVPVSDVDDSLHFFTKKMGFRQEFRYGEYAGVERDNCLLHLSLSGNPNTGVPGCVSVYLFCGDADDAYRELTELGVDPISEPRDYPYGMRDFVVADPDGNRFTFGSPISGESRSG